jgi:hypothetical protein
MERCAPRFEGVSAVTLRSEHGEPHGTLFRGDPGSEPRRVIGPGRASFEARKSAHLQRDGGEECLDQRYRKHATRLAHWHRRPQQRFRRRQRRR